MLWLEIDANLVRPGWTPLIITVILGAALAFLAFSMRKQMRRINPDLPYQADLDPAEHPDDAPASGEPERSPARSDQPPQIRRPRT